MADTISREKREGTLGLLFLTPLRPWEIVVAKVASNGLRAFTLVLAVTPVLVIPVLMGGVTWIDAVRAFVLNLAALFLALAAGLFASALCVRAARAMSLALLLGGCSALVFGALHGLARVIQFQTRVGSRGIDWEQVPSQVMDYLNGRVQHVLTVGWSGPGSNTGWRGGPGWMAPQAGSDPASLYLALAGLGFALLLTVVAVWVASMAVRRAWQVTPRSEGQLRFIRIFCTPILMRDWLKSSLNRALARNPIGWLQQYSWNARLTKWGWFVGILTTETYLVTEFPTRGFFALQPVLLNLLFLAMAFCAVSSFRRERETGVLELLAVAPLTERQILGGRLRGVWGQFLPAMVLFLVAYGYMASSLSNWYVPRRQVFGAELFGTTVLRLALVPLAGMWFALKVRHILVAWLMAAMTSLLVPGLVVFALIGGLSWVIGSPRSAWSRGFLEPFLYTGMSHHLVLWLVHAGMVVWFRRGAGISSGVVGASVGREARDAGG
jgi:ABC-type transport system involved in multi-copper enzyme maturation permease subunit